MDIDLENAFVAYLKQMWLYTYILPCMFLSLSAGFWLCAKWRPRGARSLVVMSGQDKLFEDNNFLKELADLAGTSQGGLLNLMQECRNPLGATLVPSDASASSAAVPPNPACAKRKRDEDEDRDDRDITPRQLAALVDGVASCLAVEVMDDLGALNAVEKAFRMHQAIAFKMARRGSNEGVLLRNAMEVIDDAAKTSFFKIGLTSDPAHRWSNPDYGYANVVEPSFGGVFRRMIVVHGSCSREAVGILEAALIMVSKLKYGDKCCNSAPGGEAKSKQAGALFVYVVHS